MAKLTNRKLTKPRNDLTNKKFGKLTVLSLANDRSPYRWLCQCDCGNTKVIIGDNLKTNKTTSCGCVQKAKASETHSKTNSYEFHKDYVIGKDDKGRPFIFDNELFDLVSKFYWTVTGGYVKNISNNILLHRLVTQCPKDLVVDHINHNKLDNRKNNLRICTRHENSCNLIPTSNRGVVKLSNGKYKASITYAYKHIHLGCFNTYEEALNKRLEAEAKYFKDFRYKE